MTVALTSGYRCRAHPDQVTTWQGKGCPLCPRTRKKKRPKHLRVQPNTTEEYQ